MFGVLHVNGETNAHPLANIERNGGGAWIDQKCSTFISVSGQITRKFHFRSNNLKHGNGTESDTLSQIIHETDVSPLFRLDPMEIAIFTIKIGTEKSLPLRTSVWGNSSIYRDLGELSRTPSGSSNRKTIWYSCMLIVCCGRCALSFPTHWRCGKKAAEKRARS